MGEDALGWPEIGFELRDPDMPYVENPINASLSNEPRFRRSCAAWSFP
jgi:hypothetical protein